MRQIFRTVITTITGILNCVESLCYCLCAVTHFSHLFCWSRWLWNGNKRKQGC